MYSFLLFLIGAGVFMQPQKKLGILIVLVVAFHICSAKITTKKSSYPGQVITHDITLPNKKERNISETIKKNLSYQFADEDNRIENIDVAVVNQLEHYKPKLTFDWGNLTGKFQIKYKPEFFYAKNANLLNNNNRADRIIFWRSTIDVNIGLDYGKETYCKDVLNFFATIRNKARWGVPGSVARTSKTSLKLLDVKCLDHEHFLNRQIMWIRELWLRFSINDAFSLPFHGQHDFTIGSFPFELGRGISLGAAFAVNPGVLGFFSDNTIDQYAFGFKLSGDLGVGKSTYDIYTAILENKSDTLRSNVENIYNQRFNFQTDPERGSGHINFVTAARIRWFLVQEEDSSMIFEPYVMVNSVPETKVDFPADSKAVLGTFGLAAEFVMGNFEFGFDTARNLGKQSVFGWDRNEAAFENFQSFPSEVNAQVFIVDEMDPDNCETNSGKVPFVPGSDAQDLIDDSGHFGSASKNCEILDGLIPDPRDPTQMIRIRNSINRFRNNYGNILKGWMIVFDGGYWFREHTMRVAVGGGVASGDENPNFDLDDPNNSKVDGDFKGFIGLQEIYTGNRIQSVFLLGGAGRIPRILSKPRGRNVINKFPSRTSGFTNLIFVGASYYWTETICGHFMEIRPNVFSFWQYRATKAFDRMTGESSDEFARNHLGVEVNAFTSFELIKDFKLYVIGSAFVPGAHYADIKGTPLEKAHQKLLDCACKNNIDRDTLPLLGDDPAWTINMGLEFRF